MTQGSNAILVNQCIVLNGGVFDYGIRARGTGFCRYVVNSILENAQEAEINVESGWVFGLHGSWIDAGAPATLRRGVVVKADAEQVTIQGNRLGHQSREAIYSEGHGVVIDGNTIRRNSNGSATADSVRVDGGSHVIVTNNWITSHKDRYAAYITGDADRFIVTGNDFTPAEYDDFPDDIGLVVDASGGEYVVDKNLNPPASTDGDGDDDGEVDPTGSRSDDGSAFTGGQTNQMDLSVTANKPVRVRDQVPAEWTVVEGDAHVVYEESGTKYVEFGGKKKTVDVTYLAEAPSGLTDSKTYTFGPIEASHEGKWVSVDGTADDNVVVGEET